MGLATQPSLRDADYDLQRRKTIALLPDREPAIAEAWLTNQPQIAVVARDRGGGYALATLKALPAAIQVADRWHLMENASYGAVTLPREGHERSTPYGFLSRRDGFSPRGHRRGVFELT